MFTPDEHPYLYKNVSSNDSSRFIKTLDIFSIINTCMPLYEFFQRNRHLLLNSAGVVNMAGDVEQLCARVPLSSKTKKPRASTTTDSRCHRHSLHIGNSCRTTKHTFKVKDRRIFQKMYPTGFQNTLLCIPIFSHQRQQEMGASSEVFLVFLLETQ